MDLDDTLRDRLSAAASSTTTRPLRAAATVRRSAERHRSRRRGAAAVVVVATAAVAVALGTSLGPQLLSAPPAVDPTPSVSVEPTPAPSDLEPPPSTPPPETETEAPPPPAVTQAEATAFVEAFRFEEEDLWAANVDFPVEVDTSGTSLPAFGCREGESVGGALAVRSVVAPGPDVGLWRQVGVYASQADAADSFATLRETMRACHAEPRRFDDSVRVTETTYVGGQLELGDESFWIGQRIVVVSATDGQRVGEEEFYAMASLLVLDGPTITVVDDPAHTDAGRAEFVESATAEWERLRPQLEDLGG